MHLITTLRRRPTVALLTASALALAACGGDGTGPNASSQVGLGFQLARTSPSLASATIDGTPVVGAAPAVSQAAEGLTITRGTDVIVITDAQIVVKDVKLKRSSAVCVDDDDDDDDDSRKSSSNRGAPGAKDDDDDDDECPTIRVGPYLVDVPVTGADAGRVSVAVPEGTYSSVRFRIHKVTSSDSADRAFRQANPDFRDISVRLEGTYNGRPFTFVSDVNASLEVPLKEPLTIGSAADNVTVTIDVALWFMNPSGGLYSPALANTPGMVQAKVQNNIRNAFRAFRDRNRDGKDD